MIGFLFQITLTAGAIRIPSLHANQTWSKTTKDRLSNKTKKPVHETYQLCACNDGKLFMAQPHSICSADYHICASS